MSKRAKVETAPALLPHFSASQNALSKYIKSISMMNVASAREYSFRLQGFASFIYNEYGIDLDNLITKLNKNLLNPYDVLSNYIVHLKANDSISTLTLKQRVTTTKNFLE